MTQQSTLTARKSFLPRASTLLLQADCCCERKDMLHRHGGITVGVMLATVLLMLINADAAVISTDTLLLKQ